jgi:hypothetical protein
MKHIVWKVKQEGMKKEKFVVECIFYFACIHILVCSPQGLIEEQVGLEKVNFLMKIIRCL